MKDTIRQFGAILRKDAAIEFRTREILYTLAIFSLLLVVVFAFAFLSDTARAREYGPGIMWVTILFFSTIGNTRLFDRERENNALWSLLLAPVDSAVVFAAKVVSGFLLTCLMEVVALPVIFLFFDLEVAAPGLLIGGLLLGTLALTLVETLFAAMLMKARMKEVLLPVVTYPLLMPVLIAGVKITAASLGVSDMEPAGAWLSFLAGFDLVVLGVSLPMFGRMIRA